MFKRNDIILTLSLTASALTLWAVLALSGLFLGKADKEAVVSVNGIEKERYPLSEDVLFLVNTEYGENVVEIKDGVCFVRSADCPDRLCVKQGGISRTGEAIICLPHRLTVKIESTGAGEEDYDAVAR